MSINGSKSSFGSKNSVNQKKKKKKKEDTIHKDESKWSAERPKPVRKNSLKIFNLKTIVNSTLFFNEAIN